MGFSFFLGKSAKYFQKKLDAFQKKHINRDLKDWKIINVLSKDASTVGGFDLDIVNTIDGYNNTLEKLNKNEFELIFLFGQDNLNFLKKNEFIVYIGSHGDKGAEIADIVLPSPAYTEQNGYYTNLEGKMQKAYKATYPPGSAKEEWLILNDISKLIKNGAEGSKIHEKIYNEFSLDKLKLLSISLNNIKRVEKLPVVYMTLNQNELDKCFFKKGDSEGFVNYGLSVKGIKLSIILIENKDEKIIKMSFRSKGNFPANLFAEKFFNGGGHTNAAGGFSKENLTKTVSRLIINLNDFFNEV